MASKKSVLIVDGSVDFAGGVNSYVVPTIASEKNPNGLKRNQLAWMDNATVRGGGIVQRPGWKKLGNYPQGAVGLYQGKFMYEPDSENPYQIVAVGGHIWKMNPDDPSHAVDLSAQFGVTLPSDLTRYYFAQAEQFLLIQPGDLLHLPLIWDGTTLRKSLGLSGMGLEFATSNFGTFVGLLTAGFAQPALLGSTGVVTTAATFALGSIVYFMSGTVWNSTTGQILKFGIVLSSYKVTAATPGVDVTMQLLGYDAAFPPATAMPVGMPMFTLNSTPTQFTPGTAEIPAATAMDYFMGRLWYAQGRQYSAGDIVGDQSSGTLPYAFRDSVLKVTENPLAVGGDGFTVPTNAGNIRAIKHTANINTQLGQGQLYIFTRRSVYSLTVPVSRFDWISASNTGASAASTMPLQTVVQVTNGAVNDRSIAAQNGDLFFQSLEPSIRSLTLAVRYYDQWGNVPISINENRILKFNDRSLMQYASGISFDNRVLQTVLPAQTPVGVGHRAIIPLNFDVISTFEQRLPPVWEGMYEGLSILELATADFGGRQRAFATTWSDIDRHMQLWELTEADRFEGDDNRVSWYAEFPAFTWGDEFAMKKLVSAELWIDRIYGEVLFSMDYRPDGDPCWYPWHRWQLCTARHSCEDVHHPECLYPKEFCESFRQTITLPKPPEACQSVSKRPAYYGFQFQPRLSIKGFCRIRGILLKAEAVEQETYGDMVC